MRTDKAYDIKEHRHRFSVWTAARAIRAFTSNNNITSVINKTSLREFAESDSSIDKYSYDAQHIKWCLMIISEFEKLGINTSYGQAAKIIAIYLKTSVILGRDPISDSLKFIHPPIDSILLKALSSNEKFKDFKDKTWTKFNKDQYWGLVERIRVECGSFNWELEEHWFPK